MTDGRTEPSDLPDDIPLGFGGIEASVGNHIAHFFEGDDQRFSVLGPYIKTGLRRENRCVFISRPDVGARLCSWLSDRGIDVDDARAAGQLIVHPGRATKEDMVRLADRIESEARDDEEPFVRWAGDGEWALEQDTTVSEMLRWEALYDEHSSGWRLLALCQFDLMTFDRGVIMDALRSHPYCVMGEVVVPNPLHEPPEAVLEELVTEQ
jgi:hypothetical protein